MWCDKVSLPLTINQTRLRQASAELFADQLCYSISILGPHGSRFSAIVLPTSVSGLDA